EFTYATTARVGQRVSEPALIGINFYLAGGPPKTDFSYAIDQLQAAFPACQTVAVVCAWFGNSTLASSCKIYPSTTYINNGTVINPATGLPWPTVPNAFAYWNGSSSSPDHWRVSSLDETSPGIIPISSSGGRFTYGGTPADSSIVDCIQDLKARGFRVVFYPFILMDDAGKSWRGRITYSPDVSPSAASAVNAFLGSCVTTDFVRVPANKTVTYNGPTGTNNDLDFTYRRMVLHYANLCVIAGGVDLFLIGSEFRGLETIRGPGWTVNGTTDGGGKAIWDYPFVAGLITLSDDVRSVFDAAALTKDTVNLHNLISYASDWSDWMGWQHPGANPATGVPGGAQWPHLDQLWTHANIDLVCFDNYMPLSDWTTGFGARKSNGQSDNLDIANWSAPAAGDQFFDYGRVAADSVVSAADYGSVLGAFTSQLDYRTVSAASAWPPAPSVMGNLGLSGQATIYSKDYFKANIEGGEKFNWFYFNSNNLGRGLDPLGSDLQVSRPEGDRLTQSRTRFFPQQQILGNKQLRWWWNNTHQVMYDDGLGGGDLPHGPATKWIAQSKPIVFTEYGFPACDKSTNQPNVFFDPKSTESFTAYWSI
ncbi:MAG: baseplate megatron protein TIM-barrel domain-containing protein, partial [Methylocella sp.]